MAAFNNLNREPNDSSITGLSQDILGLIFESIYETSPLTLRFLMGVNRQFYASAYALRHRDQYFFFKEDMQDQHSKRSLEILKDLLKDPSKKHVLDSIRTITVYSEPKLSSWSEYGQTTRMAHENKWLLFVDILLKVPALKKFTLQGTDQLPIPLLVALEKCHPQAHLHIQNWTRVAIDEDHNNAAELALARSPNLRSVQTRLMFDTTASHHNADLRRAALRRIVALSPNLEVLDVAVGPGHLVTDMNVEESDDDEVFQEEERLSELFMKGVTPSPNSIRSLSTLGEEFFVLLREATDLSKLESFQMNESGDFFNFLEAVEDGQEFLRLKHLSLSLSPINHLHITEAFEKIILTYCGPLESLRLPKGAFRISLPTILSHAATLRTLALHSEEGHGMQSTYPISLGHVQELSQHCRILEDITLDIDNFSSNGNFIEILFALATLPLLRTIRIYHPLEVATEQARTPYVVLDEDEIQEEIELYQSKPYNPIEDPCWLEKTWSFLRHEKKKHGSVPLKELHVKVGEWEREIGNGDHAGWAIYEAANRRYYVVTPHERDDRPDDINIYIEGTKPYSQVDRHEIRRIPEFEEL